MAPARQPDLAPRASARTVAPELGWDLEIDICWGDPQVVEPNRDTVLA
jgi:hypothetical protein